MEVVIIGWHMPTGKKQESQRFFETKEECHRYVEKAKLIPQTNRHYKQMYYLVLNEEEYFERTFF